MICPHCGKETDPEPIEKQQDKLHNYVSCLIQTNFIAMACDRCTVEPLCEYVGKFDYSRLKRLNATSHRRTQEMRKGVPEGDSVHREISEDPRGE